MSCMDFPINCFGKAVITAESSFASDIRNLRTFLKRKYEKIVNLFPKL